MNFFRTSISIFHLYSYLLVLSCMKSCNASILAILKFDLSKYHILSEYAFYDTTNISRSCRYNNSRSKNGNLKSAGNYKGRKLIWMYEKKFIEEYGIEAYNNLIQIK